MALLQKGSVTKKQTEPYLMIDGLIKHGDFPTPQSTPPNSKHTLIIPNVALETHLDELDAYYDRQGFDLCEQVETPWSIKKEATRFLIVEQKA